MTKTEKKLDNAIREVLMLACQDILGLVDGFEWLTHQVNMKSVATTLMVSCIFDSQLSQSQAVLGKMDKKMLQIIGAQLAYIGIHVKNRQYIRFDNEERCLAEHSGNWALRLAD
ncbi:Fis family transcriptional regulator [uncultured Shewanella sp.]|uniref:Fis family transcriptional regulator n=1 Tax=uncultured Shewanella sp. TaxID=173975 RepID=UPI00262C1E7A|nr:Fis family transcriptional regulator [uncultured Shewanella sp.]